ncbi:MAG: hypothetical protein ABMA25_02270, partial [Ilumatobacteraceae bacterium]
IEAMLTLHTQYGFDIPGLTLPTNGLLSTTGGSKPGTKWSMIAGGKTSQVVINWSPNTIGGVSGNKVVTSSDGTGSVSRITTSTVVTGKNTEIVTQNTVTNSSGITVATGPTTTTTTHKDTPSKSSPTFDSLTIKEKDAEGREIYNYTKQIVTNPDGTKEVTFTSRFVTPDGSTVVGSGVLEYDKNGEVVSGSMTSTTTDANGKVINEYKETYTKGYFDPDLEMAMGWSATVSAESWKQVVARINSTVLTVEGHAPAVPAPGTGPVVTSPRGPLVALIDPENGTTVFSAGTPVFTSSTPIVRGATPDYDPMLDQLRGEVRNGNLPPGETVYTHTQP